MSEFVDKARDKAQQAQGHAKETAGKVTGDQELQDEGHADKAKGNLKEAGEKVKDVFRH